MVGFLVKRREAAWVLGMTLQAANGVSFNVQL
jgi:hypothetical protein